MFKNKILAGLLGVSLLSTLSTKAFADGPCMESEETSACIERNDASKRLDEAVKSILEGFKNIPVYRIVPPSPYPCKDEGAIYPFCSDQMAIYSEAFANAKAEHKLLLVTLGASWCPWCTSIHKWLYQEKIASEYADRINSVEIAVSGLDTDEAGKAHKRHIHTGKQVVDLLTPGAKNVPAPDKFGYPLFVMVNPETDAREFYSSDVLEDNGPNDETPGHDPAKIRAMISQLIESVGASK